MLRRGRLRTVATVVGAIVFFLLVLSQLRGGQLVDVIPAGTPSVVLVTVIDTSLSMKFNQMIMDNRREYAAMHGMSSPLRTPPVLSRH